MLGIEHPHTYRHIDWDRARRRLARVTIGLPESHHSLVSVTVLISHNLEEAMFWLESVKPDPPLAVPSQTLNAALCGCYALFSRVTELVRLAPQPLDGIS